MLFIPVNQIESVDLVIHALRVAGGEADCTVCPVRKVCMKQCLSLAEGLQRLAATNSLPRIEPEPQDNDEPPPEPVPGGSGGHLRIIK